MAITAAMVKELRERTAAGMMDCKKALVEAEGDMELAIENMRKSGAVKAAKKAGRIAAEGVVKTKIANGVAVLVEINSETDFVAKDASFLAFANQVVDVAHAGEFNTAEALLAAKYDAELTVEEARANLISKIGENINVRRSVIVKGDNMASYIHGGTIGVVTVLKGGDEALAKKIAMHVAAAKPEFVTPEDVPASVVEKERAIQVEIAINSGKPQEIAEKMVVGRMKKFTGEVSLTGQAFIMEPSKTVGQLLKEEGAEVVTFIRIEVGEGIEKAEDDFAAEVAATVAAAKKA
ncbi:MAG: elongation factor Ts [Moritella sp.]|uniref:translation elongation factor Ts n=1 Tax=unclassified Moritella TaxID=2637987 RepID=UPI000156856F|nr:MULTISPECIES: translation elongation factor Ts [unclassified Moritella]EDM69151.1 elongation factor Ts [Moritella sp. PE36]MBL1418766.1 elongation factor Ts [Moritella sp.]PHR87109.1 MAG: elongation factor Ts [Moritella sp.]